MIDLPSMGTLRKSWLHNVLGILERSRPLGEDLSGLAAEPDEHQARHLVHLRAEPLLSRWRHRPVDPRPWRMDSVVGSLVRDDM